MIKEKTIEEILQEAVFSNSPFPELENDYIDPIEKMEQMSDTDIVSILSTFLELLEQGIEEVKKEKNNEDKIN
jgi:hypothetical protein